MAGLVRMLLPIALLAFISLAPATAEAGLKAKTSVTTKSGATRLVTKLTSDSPLGAQKRPRKVKLKGGGETYKLSKAGEATAAVVKLGTWRSDSYRGADAQAILDLAGDKVKVIVRSLAGTTTLRSKVTEPEGSTPPPGTDPTDPAPGTDPTDPPDPEPGDITGQEAIDQMTAELNGMFVHDPGTTEYSLHMCETGDARYFSQSIYEGMAFATEKFGKPWSVTDAIIRPNGDRAAIVHVTWTLQHDETGAYQETNEPFDTLLENVGGQWYWEGALSTAGQGASCEPSF